MAAKNQADFRARAALAIVLAESARDSEAEQAAQVEYDRCERSCHYFINNHAIIEDVQGHGDGSGKMPFKLWEAQSDLLTTIMQSPRVVVLKARQLGISWLICVYCLWRCLFRRGQTILFFSQGEDEASELLGRVLSVFEEIAPALAAKLPKLIKSNSTLLEWDNGSRIKSMPATQKAGRGLTASLVVMDEAAWAMWAEQLYVAANATVADKGEIIICSTANGMGNFFHKIWQIASKGAERFVAAFLPWHARPDRDQAFYDQQVAASTDPMMVKQEFPATPEDAFVASGRKVFDPAHVKRVFIATALTDPLNPTAEHPGPEVGKLIVKKKATRPMPNGDELVVPTEAGWLPASKLELGETADWRIYEQPKEGEQYVAGVDVSGGEIAGERGEPAYHAIEIIHHKTRVQVAEYRSRLDPDLLAEQVLLGALLYNEPWLAIEITGSWGAPIARKLWFAYHYKFMYFRQKHDRKVERSEDRLGWNTGRDTKPILEANTTELLREESHGIRSRGLAEELATYVRLPSGKSEPEPGKYADRLMAWQIAQQVALEKPVKRDFGSQPARPVRNRVTGW